MTAVHFPRTSLFSAATLCLLVGACNGDAPSSSSTPDGGTAAPPSSVVGGGDCVPTVGPGKDHDGEITADETWSASDSPHRIKNGVRILATVTIEACTKVELGERANVEIGNTGKAGKLVTSGTSDPATHSTAAVSFVPADAAKRWGSIIVNDSATADFSVTVLSGAADPAAAQSGGGALRVFGKSNNSVGGPPEITKSVRARTLLITGPGDVGVNLVSLAGFTDDSQGLFVSGAAGAAIRVEQGAVGALPAEIGMDGNGRNEIDVDPGRLGVFDHTFRDRGFPYRINGPMYVQPHADGLLTTMTVEPGVTLRFAKTSGSGLIVGSSDTRKGMLVARGTAAKPITFTSAETTPAAGDWVGVYFRYSPPTGNAIENAILEFAGGDSTTSGFGCGPKDNDATILVLSGRPDDAFVKTSILRNGGGGAGIVLGWTSDVDGPDFLATNTFVSVPPCRVSRWRTVAGACPGANANGEVCF